LLHLLRTRQWLVIQNLLPPRLLHLLKTLHLLRLKTLVPLLYLLWLLESPTQPTYTSTPSAECHMLTRLYAEDAERHIA
jgi:hypothetical protein